MAQRDPLHDKLVVLIGGAGFVGTHVAQDLLERGARLRIADHNPGKAFRLKPMANLGQIQFTRCDVTSRRSVDLAMRDADAAVYLVGTFGGNQKALQADGAGMAAQAAAEQGADAFVYISAIGADPASDSGYASTKGMGEEQVREAFPAATVLRPSVMFGEDDKFINMFAGMIANVPVLPVFGYDSRLQPVWVDDVAAAVATALADPGAYGGKTYEIAGPEAVTLGTLHERIAAGQRRQRTFVPVPDMAASAFAAIPFTPMNSDQWKLLKRGSVADPDMPGLAALGIEPRPLDLFLERWMVRYRKHGRFGTAPSAV